MYNAFEKIPQRQPSTIPIRRSTNKLNSTQRSLARTCAERISTTVCSSNRCPAEPAAKELLEGRRRILLSIALSACCFVERVWADEEGTVTYIDISANPNLTPLETTAVMNNLKIQSQNQVPAEFPTFIREGFNVKIIASGYTQDTSGLIYKDIAEGIGDLPADDEQVTFDYIGYNENGARIDSTYIRGNAAAARIGAGNLIPGFELALRGMKPGGKRRVVIPPALGPPVGPSTFFSAKQCEVFDIELRDIKTCRQQTLAMFSRVICE